jgi:hypothetical protein
MGRKSHTWAPLRDSFDFILLCQITIVIFNFAEKTSVLSVVAIESFTEQLRGEKKNFSSNTAKQEKHLLLAS